LLESLFIHTGMAAQLEEWVELGMVEADFSLARLAEMWRTRRQ
jgi:hypothetical protein